MKIFQSILLLTFIGGLTKISHAQEKKFVLSAPLQYSATNNDNNFVQSKNAHDFLINPQLIYRINKHWAFGPIMRIGISKRTQGTSNDSQYDASNINATYKEKYTTMKYGLNLQRYLYDNDKVQLFTEINGLFGNFKHKTIEQPDGTILNFNSQNYNSFEAGLHIGGRYQFTKALGIEARINQLISYSEKSYKEQDDKNSQINVISNVFNNASIGISYSF